MRLRLATVALVILDGAAFAFFFHDAATWPLPVLVVGAAALLGLYDPEATPRRDTRLVAAALATSLAAAAFVLLDRLLGAGAQPPVVELAGAMLLGQLGREGLGALLRRRARPAVILGTGPRARELGRALQRSPFGPMRLLGFVAGSGRAPLGMPRLTAPPPGALVLDSRALRAPPIAAGRERELELPDMRLRAAEGPGDGVSRRLKRAIDLILVFALAPLALPLFLLFWLLTRVFQGPGAIHRQVRVTRGRRFFSILKFRSMPRDAELEGQPVWPTAEDPRTTPFGRFLRRTWLDELPQLWNVIRGDLSLVGPRPERPEFVQVFESCLSRYAIRHRTRAGITGLAQVRGFVGNTSLRKRLLSDLHQVENWSIWLDVAVLGRTLCQVLQRQERQRFDYVPGDEGPIP